MIKIDPKAFQALGLDAVAVNAILHLLHMVGNVENSQTLPQTVMQVALEGPDATAATVAELRKDFEASLIDIPGGAALAELQKEVAALRQQVETFTSSSADLAELRKWAEGVAVSAIFPGQATDWEHPGKLGDKTPNTGALTSLNVDPTGLVGTALLPALYLGVDKTTGFYRSAANELAFSISAVQQVKYSIAENLFKQNVKTEKQFVSTVATGTAPLEVASETLVPNLYAARAALADSLGTAGAYPANATDLASNNALTNYIKDRLISKGV